MKAWVLERVSELIHTAQPLRMVDMEVPVPKNREILIKISCCGVCHTELDEIEGRTPPPNYPVIPGHQVVGKILQCGPDVELFKTGDRVGVAWIFTVCGNCEFCKSGLENLCPDFQGTGRDRHGGYAEFMVVDERFAYDLLPLGFPDAETAPLLCAGAIGYRSLKLTGLFDGQTLGLTGFGASGHLVLKMAQYLYPQSEVYVFARSGEEQDFARQIGANWSGDITDRPPAKANAIIDTTPVWKTVMGSLLHLKPGGRLVINAIRKEPQDLDSLLGIRYQEHLWMEKEIKTVANIVRSDIKQFLLLAGSIPLTPTVEKYPFDKANQAILDLKNKYVKGAKVLVME